jgi:hypothetical protein
MVSDGSPATFNVSAEGCVAPTYQWLKGTVAIRAP